ncbi:MAG: SGNH/GDSL hydrolase family protein [Muribaculaceae bacterium]
MTRFKTLIALVGFVAITLATNAQQAPVRVSILGDSYSTFEGYIPEGNAIWYGPEKPYSSNQGNDVRRVYDTWWYHLIDRHDLKLEVNESWSGSTICTTGYRGEDATEKAYITRADRLGKPDVILVFGGTNDSWAGSPWGDYKYSDWTTDDLKQVRPAMCYLFHRLKELYPDALIYNIENTELKTEYYQSCEVVCRHYGIKRICLHHISKQFGHPSIDGMRAISEQVWQMIGGRITAGQVK